MEFQHLLPTDLTILDSSYTGTPLEASLPQQDVLQERSTRWLQKYSAIPIMSASPDSATPKSSHSHCPTENVLPSQVNLGGSFSTGNTPSNPATLTGFSIERSEKQVKRDLKRLYKLLARSDKYQKYREKQPILTPEELIAKETIEAAREKEERDKEKVVWPEFLERAFWTALVKWPPMGRKKYMLNGTLRGRNELVQDFIAKNTGIKRDRKQVSSHIQVLKQLLKDQPGVLIYMATLGNENRRHRGSESSSAYRLSHCDAQPQRGILASQYNVATWPYDGESLNQGSVSSPFSIIQFAMIVEEEDYHVHTFTQLCSDGRLADVSIADLVTWSKQYPEFAFLSPRTQEWAGQERNIIVCDASLKMMDESTSNTHLSISFDLRTQYDLSGYEALQCTTRFYDDRDMALNNDSLKEENVHCEFVPDNGRLRLAFGSAFWVDRISQYHAMTKDEVDNSLTRLTATLDLFGFQRGSEKAECLLTIFWRFRPTRNSTEAGGLRWRAVTLSDALSIEQRWGGEEHQTIANHGEPISLTSSSINIPFHYHTQSSGLPLDFHAAHHTYATHHPQPPQLSLNTLTSMSISDFDPNTSAVPSTATDYSHHSFAPSTVTDHSFTHETFDFTGGHMTMSGAEAFNPVISMTAYDGFTGQYGFVKQEGFSGLDMTCSVSNAELVHIGVPDTPDSACYPTQATWQHLDFLPQTYEHVGMGGEVYHDGGLGADARLWGMHSPF